MEIKSKTFSKQNIEAKSIISFPDGIPGFEEQTQFQLFQQEGSKVVYSLESISNEDIAFSVAQPVNFNINYYFVLTDTEETTLDIESTDDLLILLILHKNDDVDTPGLPTIKGSIKSPLLINTKKRIGIQKSLATVEQSITLTEKQNVIEVSET
jgi:flagellar assembly factor FliW